ncbi:hypothetical protein BARVI_07740 [Barnesiella viscericola DSM 18177]|uniref:Uncharacterized protein n=1 Tax=Barnesiella viscericola DSM 18177 TaxID=880074 RepID=W0EWA2_9BACT|nr:hypothetical protein BARVI_07740 [Barnesiella viscericola DSM 18177]
MLPRGIFVFIHNRATKQQHLAPAPVVMGQNEREAVIDRLPFPIYIRLE